MHVLRTSSFAALIPTSTLMHARAQSTFMPSLVDRSSNDTSNSTTCWPVRLARAMLGHKFTAMSDATAYLQVEVLRLIAVRSDLADPAQHTTACFLSPLPTRPDVPAGRRCSCELRWPESDMPSSRRVTPEHLIKASHLLSSPLRCASRSRGGDRRAAEGSCGLECHGHVD